MALVAGAPAGIGAIYAAATVASPLAPRAENPLVSSPILPELLRLTLPNLAAMLVMALVAVFEDLAFFAVFASAFLADFAEGVAG